MENGTECTEASKGDETRRRIVQHALVRASAIGLDALSIGGLAGELELSKSGLFAHFKSKERLQLEVLDAAAEHFRQKVFLPAVEHPRGKLRLQALFDAWLAWVHDEKLPGGCVFMGAASQWDDREGKVREQLVSWFDALSFGLRRAVDLTIGTGDFQSRVDSALFASEMHGIVLKYHLDSRLSRSEGAESLARRAFDHLMNEASCPGGGE